MGHIAPLLFKAIRPKPTYYKLRIHFHSHRTIFLFSPVLAILFIF